MTLPVSGSNHASSSTSSPNNPMRNACSSYDGTTSTMSPRTRNVPRPNSVSLRSYWISTSLRRI